MLNALIILDPLKAAVQLDSPKGSGSEWISLLTQPPFVDGLTYRHAQHSVAQGRICAAYAKLCGPLWKDEPVKVLRLDPKWSETLRNASNRSWRVL